VLAWERIVTLDDPSPADLPDRLQRSGGQSSERARELPDPDERAQAYGLVRRLEHEDGPADEALHKDFKWGHTPAIVEWKHGSYDQELVEVSHTQASKIIEYFRGRWAAQGQPVES
jgi:hypothetical protein